MADIENIYQQISDERYAILTERYSRFQKGLDTLDLEPVKVFDPLPQGLLDELDLIRRVSKDLQKKKEDDISKAAQAAKQAEADAKKKAEEDAAAAKEKEEAEKEGKAEA